MNIKKLIALGLSSMMIFSSVIASAELVANVGDGYISQLPTEAEINARTPKLDITVGEQYATIDAAKAELIKPLQKTLTDDCIYFPVTINVSDIGSLASGYVMDEAGNEFTGGCMLNGIYVTFNTDKIKIAKVTSSSAKINNIAWKHDGITSKWVAGWQAGTFAASYPSPDASEVKEDNTFSASVTYVVGVDKNITEDITITKDNVSIAVDFWVGDEAITAEYGSGTFTAQSNSTKDVTFKAPVTKPTVTPWEVTITEEPGQAHGYIWKVDTTKGDGALTKFDVTFTDDTPETFERSILSATKDAYNWNAPTSFYVGLYTTRTGVTADWKAASSTKDGKVIEATIK